MKPSTNALILTTLLLILATANTQAEINCEDYPDKDIVILLKESVNNVSLSEYVQSSDLYEDWYISSSYDFADDEIKRYISKQGVVMWTDYDKETFMGMHFQTIEAGNDTAYVLIEKFTEENAAKRIYQQFLSLYSKAGNVIDLKKISTLGIAGYGARIKHDDYVIKFIDNNNRLIHISSLNMSLVEYIADKYAHLENSLIVTEQNHWVAKVCKAQTDECTQTVYFSSDYDKYNLINCSTLHQGKRIPCPESRMELYSGMMQIPFASCEKGDVLDMVYEKTTEFPIRNKFWSPQDFYFQDYFPTSKNILKLEVPSNTQVKYISTQGLEPVKKTEENRTSFVWEKDSVEPYEVEEYMPPYREVIPRAAYTSVKSWDEVRIWFETLFNESKNTGAVKNKVNEIISDKTTDEEKAEEIYYWVRNQIRYEDSEMGFLTGYKPHSAAEVLNYKFGDCKDHSILLISMLEAAGITAYPVLVSDDVINMDAPTPYEFYHSIVAVPNGSGYIWLDPTCKYCPYGFISEEEQDANVLMLSNPSATFTKTPVSEKDKNYQSVVNYTINLKESGDAEIRINLMKTGSYGLALAEELRDADRKKVDEYLGPTIQIICSDYVLDGYNMIDSSDKQNILMELNASCNDLTSRTGNKVVYNIPTETLFYDMISKEERKYPILLETNDRFILNIEFIVSEGESVELMPENYSVSSKFASYSFDCSVDSGVVYCNRVFQQKASQMPASDFAEFKDFFGKINSQKRTIVLAQAAATKPDENQEASGEMQETEAGGSETLPSTQGDANQGIDSNIIIGALVILVLILLAAVAYFATRKKK